MKIIHIESGLGNQMLSYCEYLALQKSNPSDRIYIETIVYDIPECNDSICQWNGYELARIFDINSPNISTLFSQKEWSSIIEEVHKSKFWEKKWNYPVYITRALNAFGLNLHNVRGNLEKEEHKRALIRGSIGRIRGYFTNRTRVGCYLRRVITTHFPKNNGEELQAKLFISSDENLYTGQQLLFKLKGSGIERIKDDISRAFVFPFFADQRNAEFASFLDSCNSVFIHARRGDMLSANSWCYKYGYFSRAVSFIKRRIDNPVFVFFTNTGSIQWCKDNARIFGLDYERDKVFFVDWNTGENSFRDMQLMSHCKHGIITNSSFGWWGAYFINNPYKITISPLAEINTTHHC